MDALIIIRRNVPCDVAHSRAAVGWAMLGVRSGDGFGMHGHGIG